MKQKRRARNQLPGLQSTSVLMLLSTLITLTFATMLHFLDWVRTFKVIIGLTTFVALASFYTIEDGWAIFARVKYTEKRMEPDNELYLVPLFDSRILAYKGKEITLRGYFIPIDWDDERVIILSKVPNSQCFFHGGAGPESVAEISFPAKAPKLKPDQIVTVKGILKLNDTDINHMNFILEKAVMLADK
jgi:hypothetical protein